MKLLLLLLSFAFLCNCAAQIEKYIPSKPAFTRLYNDENAYAYYHSTWRKIEDKLICHYKKTGTQIVIAVISTTGGYPIDELATVTFRNWGIGDKEKNTGLLVLIARKERKIRIEAGYGIEGQLTDSESNVIIQDILEPALDSFQFMMVPRHPTQGYLPAIYKTADTLIALTPEINTISLVNASKQTKSKTSGMLPLIIAVPFLLLIIYLLRKKYKNETA